MSPRSTGSRAEPYPATATIDASLLEQLLSEHLLGSAAGGQAVAVVQPSVGQESSELCQFFVKAGWCKFGEGCRFRHEGIPRPPPSSTEPTAEICMFFQKAGWCKHGENCRHIHALPTAATSQLGTEGAEASALPPPGAGYGKATGKGSFQWGDESKGTGKGGGKGSPGEICDFFAKAGWCKWGEACRYLHSGTAAAAAPGAPPTTLPPRLPRSSDGETMCRYFNAPGGCKHGEACPFIHTGEPGAAEVCQFFVKSGWCKWNDQCKYLHIGPAEGAEPRPPGPREPTGEPCQFFARAGWCKYGEQCRHLHIEGVEPRPPREPLPPGSVNEPCQFFLKSGWCKWGDGCKYMHTTAGGVSDLEQQQPRRGLGSALIEGL